ncbi:endolytic transglycosylase MltG [Candidatus Peregrinibacteria bacterium]|nr:endolytic transglycosylase MltG [Candidatus Peregrinibacteria bacterium]
MRRRNSKKPIWLKIIAVLIILAAIFLIYQYQRYNYLISTPVNTETPQEINISIKKGDNTKKIAENLFAQNLILDVDAFKLYAKFNNLDKDIKSGRFKLSQNQNISEIFQTITSNQTRQAIITIPEGSTIADIDKILVDQSLTQPGDFITAVQNFDSYAKYDFLDAVEQKKLIHPLEGYLFPDTYFVNANEYDNLSFITLLLNTFKQKALPEVLKGNKPLDQAIIVASMVEKEANRDKDRPLIAGIIWKRLDSNWVLGIDATLLYLKEDREIDYQDIQEDTPYNTRNKQGLPPGPIANPGLASIKAAAQPEESSYFFYLTSKDGDMVYAVTNEEHNRNKAKYL